MIGLLASVSGPACSVSRLRRACSSCSTPSASRCRTTGSLFQTRTIVVSLLVGVIVTLLASLRPAMPRDAGATDRRRPRRGDAPARPLRPVPHARRGAADRARFCRARVGLFGNGLGTTQVLLLMGRRRAADLHRRRAVLVAVRPAAGRRREPGGPLGGLRLLRAGLAVLHVAVLAAPIRRVGPGRDREAGRCIRRRCGVEPADTADRAADGRSTRSHPWRPEWPAEFPGVVTDRSTARTGRREQPSATRSEPLRPRPP